MPTLPAIPAAESIEQRVGRLLASWREQTAYLSSSTAITGNLAYQELMELGPAVLPFLLHDLEQTRDGHLSKALTAVTGAHPVQPEDRGKMRRIAAAWLRWAKENGCQW